MLGSALVFCEKHRHSDLSDVIRPILALFEMQCGNTNDALTVLIVHLAAQIEAGKSPEDLVCEFQVHMKLKEAQEKLEEVLDQYKRFAKHFETEREHAKKAQMLTMIGDVLCRADQNKEAVEVYQHVLAVNKAVRTLNEIDDREFLETTCNVASKLFIAGETKPAAELLKKCIELAQSGGMQEVLARAYYEVGKIMNMGQQDGRMVLLQGLVEQSKAGDLRGLWRSYFAIARYGLDNKDYEGAIGEFNAALSFAKDNLRDRDDDRIFQAHSLVGLACALVGCRRLQEARTALYKAAHIYEQFSVFRGQYLRMLIRSISVFADHYEESLGTEGVIGALMTVTGP
jgi:tetratricopeptide (TPR) repeat protein